MLNIRALHLSMVLSFSLLLTSCFFDPKHIPKEPLKTPTQWDAKNKYLNTARCDTNCIAWWEQFKDPVLNALIAEGLERNNDIHVAVSNIEAAQGELKRVKWNWAPNLDSLLGYTSFPYLGYPGVITVMLPNYTINLLKQVREQEKANYELTITENMRDTVRLTVIAQIAGGYFAYLGQIEQLGLLENVEQDLQKTVNIHEATFHNGLTSEIVLAEAKSKLDLIKAQKMVIKKNIVLNQNMLRYLLNENPKAFAFNRKFSQLGTHHPILGALPVSVLQNRPDMMQAMQSLKAANAGIGIAVSNFLPTIQLTMGRGDIGTVPNGTTLGTPVYFNESLLKSPLFHPSAFGEWERTRGLAKAAYYRYLDTFRKVLKEVNNELAAHQFYTERFDQTVLAKNHLNQAYQLKKSLYNEGIISYEKLLEEKVKLDKMNIQVNKHKLEQLIKVVTLYQNLAVGYGCPTPKSHPTLHVPVVFPEKPKQPPLLVSQRAVPHETVYTHP